MECPGQGEVGSELQWQVGAVDGELGRGLQVVACHQVGLVDHGLAPLGLGQLSGVNGFYSIRDVVLIGGHGLSPEVDFDGPGNHSAEAGKGGHGTGPEE